MAQLPPTATSIATPANATTIPASMGKVPLAKGCPARVNTNGSTGRMQGLTIVNSPPRKATTKSTMMFLCSAAPAAGGRLRVRHADHQ